MFRDVGNPDNIYAMSRDDYGSDEEYAQAIQKSWKLKITTPKRTSSGCQKAARWDTLKNKAMLPTGTVLWWMKPPVRM